VNTPLPLAQQTSWTPALARLDVTSRVNLVPFTACPCCSRSRSRLLFLHNSCPQLTFNLLYRPRQTSCKIQRHLSTTSSSLASFSLPPFPQLLSPSVHPVPAATPCNSEVQLDPNLRLLHTAPVLVSIYPYFLWSSAWASVLLHYPRSGSQLQYRDLLRTLLIFI
jgi:hypothetical protein